MPGPQLRGGGVSGTPGRDTCMEPVPRGPGLSLVTQRAAHIYTKASAMETDKDTAAELYSPRRHADRDTLHRAYLCQTPANRHGEKTEMQPLHLFATSSSFLFFFLLEFSAAR